MTDLLVIGGGAAGLMAAGAACARGLTVTVLEHNPKGPGQKLLITGKGRCNVTSDSDVREFLPYVRHKRAVFVFEPLRLPAVGGHGAVRVARRAAQNRARAAGISPGVTAPPTCWPRCAIYAAMRNCARQRKKSWSRGRRLQGVLWTDRGETLRAENTLIATGGISYPATGSDGSGYRLARQAGHTIMPPQPSLCSLVSPDPACRRMMGLALRNVTLTLLCDGKPLFTEQGEALFTHFGLSGPLVLWPAPTLRI